MVNAWNTKGISSVNTRSKRINTNKIRLVLDNNNVKINKYVRSIRTLERVPEKEKSSTRNG